MIISAIWSSLHAQFKLRSILARTGHISFTSLVPYHSQGFKPSFTIWRGSSWNLILETGDHTLLKEINKCKKKAPQKSFILWASWISVIHFKFYPKFYNPKIPNNPKIHRKVYIGLKISQVGKRFKTVENSTKTSKWGDMSHSLLDIVHIKLHRNLYYSWCWINLHCITSFIFCDESCQTCGHAIYVNNK